MAEAIRDLAARAGASCKIPCLRRTTLVLRRTRDDGWWESTARPNAKSRDEARLFVHAYVCQL